MSLCTVGPAARGGMRVPDPLLQFLPEGMTLYCDTTLGGITQFSTYNAAGLAGDYDWANTSDPSAPWGPDCFDILYAGDVVHAGNGGGWLIGQPTQSWRRIYFGLSVYLPDYYITHSAGEKFFYPTIATPGYSLQNSYIDVAPVYTGTNVSGPLGSTMRFGLITQATGFSTVERPADPETSARLIKAQWNTVAGYAEMNTPGNADGVCRLWCNGQGVFDYSGVRWSGHPVQSTFDRLRFTGTRGGGAADRPTPPGGQFRRYNRLAFYGSTT